jgi:hypothetical protein
VGFDGGVEEPDETSEGVVRCMSDDGCLFWLSLTGSRGTMETGSVASFEATDCAAFSAFIVSKFLARALLVLFGGLGFRFLGFAWGLYSPTSITVSQSAFFAWAFTVVSQRLEKVGAMNNSRASLGG